jgi:hypothetical protein
MFVVVAVIVVVAIGIAVVVVVSNFVVATVTCNGSSH